jgi:hypothetical protein
MWMKIAVFIWPFLKEMILGDRTLKEAVKSNKIRVLTIGIIFLSLALNFFAFPRLVSITKQHLELAKKYKDVQAELESLKAKKPPPVVSSRAAEPPPEPLRDSRPVSKPNAVKPTRPTAPKLPASTPHGKPDDDEEERRRKLQERLEKIKRDEEAQRIAVAARKEPSK